MKGIFDWWSWRWAKARRRTRFVMVAGGAFTLVVVLTAAMVWVGANTDRLPSPNGAKGPGPTVSPGATAPASVSAASGDSGHVTSSTGADFGASLPRLKASPFAKTSDPKVFALSVQASVGYDYSSVHPADPGGEAKRITDSWLSGMTGEDGPLGAEKHKILRQAMRDSISPDFISYQIDGKQRDDVDVLGVMDTENSTLRNDVGNEVYLKVVDNRDTLHALTTTARVKTTMQQVGDVSGFVRTTETALNMIVRCDPAVNGGACELVGIVGGGTA
ncbi:hypothetical protein [Actinomyces oris]|uniref:hypothetical protein n=1 Tax=Actinomyces oris TaxID=544580 RepID=UPI000A5621C6|nr:hypothetical protein [Actinomyces oris]